MVGTNRRSEWEAGHCRRSGATTGLAVGSGGPLRLICAPQACGYKCTMRVTGHSSGVPGPRTRQPQAYFRRVRPVWGGVGWPYEQDLNADSLYCAGTPVTRAAARPGRDDRSQPPAPMAAQSDPV